MIIKFKVKDFHGYMTSSKYYYLDHIPLVQDEILERVLFSEAHRKTFGRINIGDLDKIISYMHLKLPLKVNFNVRVLCKWHCRY